MNCACSTCRGLGYVVSKPGTLDAWPDLCPMCGGKGRLHSSKLEELLQVSADALDKIDNEQLWRGAPVRGQPVLLETYVRVLDRIAKVFPEALR